MVRRGIPSSLAILDPPEELPNDPNNNDQEVNGNFLEGFPEINKEDLQRIVELGHGSSGVVWKVKHKTFNKIMAQKIIHLEIKQSSKTQIIKELRILHRCKNPNIVDFYGAFSWENNISICMEYMDGLSLDILLKKAQRIPEPILGKISVAVLNGLHYLKSELDIMHRDVKPSNILLNTKGEIKLCDFGVSKELVNSMVNTFVGTRSYMAPERITGMAYNIKSDVWSFGVSLVELATGRYPLPHPTAAEWAQMFNQRIEDIVIPSDEQRNPAPNVFSAPSNKPNRHNAESMAIFELLNYIVDEPPPTLPRGIFSDDFTDTVEICLKKDPAARADLKILIKHPFIEKAVHSNVDFAGWVTSLVCDHPNFTRF